ncbi:MAG: DegT/DnrJ/EryC1/StrS family aminotransferase [Verrucomicrobia bacterium]|jgi:perosamine synthetase|nr:DegT/DnrJ/EryC1/StrS family aminotransferase [Verrucomicrobiota bacterium]MBT7068241.1 DegT/DnrJ/EryC1/StrS family aminotransferase [Verrucomicrobiota bacterium]MBT7699623.1 DegT/DnrJ/EryC1/StrS family aminotransferase [Verrucomicrobiota bacterium]
MKSSEAIATPAARSDVPWWWVDIGDDEARAIVAAIRDHRIQCGPICRELESRLAEELQVAHVVMMSSGSAALAAALMACGIGPGDEVIIPAASYIATAHACLLIGAKVVLVDIGPDRPVIDPAGIEAAVTDKTRAIMPVHLNGAACDMGAIGAIAKRHGLRVVEDAAQAFCSRTSDRFLGTQGDVGAFSMSIAKLVTTGEGGFAVTNDDDLADRLHKARNQGVQAVANNLFDALGFNFRLTDMLAAMGVAQLGKLEEKVDTTRRVYAFYKEALADLPTIDLLPCRIDEGELPLWPVALCRDRERVVELLAARGIQTRPVNPCLAESPQVHCAGRFENAQRFAAAGLRLPGGPDQPRENLERTAEALHDIGNSEP